MRPIKLSMQAFGPFRQRETIDFSAFGSNPLFLINGPTGSGKTTLLDAICFALYGKTTGGEREGNQMRSHHAADDLITEIDFTFALGEKVYRVLRQPDQERAKKRGTGTVTQQAQADFWRIEDDGHETVISTRKVNDANAGIESRIGLSADQFRQVIVLPQGQFRQLLLADSKDREAIFSRLFQTQNYHRLEKRLSEQAGSIRQQAEHSTKLQENILAMVELETFAELEAELQPLTAEYTAIEKKKKQAQQHLQQCRTALDQAQQLAQAFSQLQTAEQQLTQLQDQQEVIDGERQQLAQARAADTLTPAYKDWQHATITHETANTQQHDYQTQRSTASNTRQQAETTYNTLKAKLEPQQHILQKQTIELENLRPRIQPLQAAVERCLQLAKTHQQQQTQLESLRTQQESNQTELKHALQQSADLTRRQQEIPAFTLRLHELDQQLELRQQLTTQQQQYTELRQQLTAASQQTDTLIQQHQQADKAQKQLELDWHQGQAILLAQELKTDLPCPVCGSSQHPVPAQGETLPPTQQQLDKARKKTANALEKYHAALQQYTLLQSQAADKLIAISELENKLNQADSTDNPDELQQEQQTLTNDLAQRQQEQQQLEALTAAIRQLEQQQQQLEAAHITQQQEYQQTGQHLQQAHSDQQHLESELPERWRTPQALETAINDTQQKQQDIRQQLQKAEQCWREQREQEQELSTLLKTATVAAERAESGLQAVQQVWQQQLNTSIFSAIEAYQSALKSSDQQVVLEKKLTDYTAARQQAETLVAERRKAVAGQQLPDSSTLEAQLADAAQAVQHIEQQLSQLSNRLHQLSQAQQHYQKISAEQQALDAQYKVIGTLANLANGRNTHKLSLQRFVLGVLLDDVLIAATQRFYQMSKGRYELRRKEERNKGNKASGLDLLVADTYTGKERDVATLSGGESFMAALSLALGLSDVIQGYAGGIRLDTLFIDEGFGSLDEASLELAIRTLTELRDNGRMVGIISHVAELKNQIPQRLDISLQQDGSRVRFVG